MKLFSGKRPHHLGHKSGQLAKCPPTPNCVSSQGSGKSAIAPYSTKENPDSTWKNLVAIINLLPEATVVQQNEEYLHAEFSSALLGFVDDVEFYHDTSHQLIHCRSASRLGFSDLGKNRQRIEKIRKQLATQ